MSAITDFLSGLARAVAQQPGLIQTRSCDASGNLDTLGAFAYMTEADVRNAVELLRTGNAAVIRDAERSKLQAAVSERALELALPILGSAGVKAINDYNDGRTRNKNEQVVPETPRELRNRIGAGLREGNVPGLEHV